MILPSMRLPAVVFAICLCSSCGKKPGSQSEIATPAKLSDSTGAAAFEGKFQDLTEAPGTVFQVTYSPETIPFTRAEVRKTVRSVSHDGQVYVFDPSSEQAQKIHVGSVLFLKNLVVRKVIAVATDPAGLAVATEPAAITDLIQDGHLKWEAPVRFAAARERQRAAVADIESSGGKFAAKPWLFPTVSASPLPSPVGAQNQDAEQDGWKFHQQSSVEANRLSIHMTLDNPNVVGDSGGNMNMHISGDGYVQDFDTSAGMDIQGGTMQHFDYTWKNLNGLLNFHWEAGTDAPGVVTGEEKLSLPAAFEVPFPIGGIPFILAVGEAILIRPGFTGNRQSAEGDFHIEYNGTTGIKIGSGSVEEEGAVHGTFGITSARATSMIGALGMVVALALPRLELKLGAENPFEILKQEVPSFAQKVADELEQKLFSTAVKKMVKNILKTEASATFQIVTSTSAFATGNMVAFACQRSTIIVTGSISADAKLLGKTVGEIQPKQVFRKEIDQGTKGGACKVSEGGGDSSP